MIENNMRISVRNLIEFIYRQGDIDDRIGGMSSAQEGTRLHKVIQKELKEQCEKNDYETYINEMYLSRELSYKDVTLTLEGRADGVIVTENPYDDASDEDSKNVMDNQLIEYSEEKSINEGESNEASNKSLLKVNNISKKLDNKKVKIIEIKTTMKDLLTLEENENFLHWAQGKLYGHIYCEKEDLDGIDLDLIYCHRENLHTKTFSKSFTREELKTFFYEVMYRYVQWINLQSKWIVERNDSIEKLNFPFNKYRKGQRELAVNIYRTIKEKKDIYVEAPTGIGKTISTIFPAVKSIPLNTSSKLVYLTAKNITKGVAENSLGLLRKSGLKLRTLTLTAKDRICFLEERVCNGDACKYAKGHFDRVNDAILDMIENNQVFNEEIIKVYSEKHNVCPFELSLDLIAWCDFIIGDYNYFFDPKAMIKRVSFDDTPYIFLIDEAHNLVDRGRDMYSSEINTSDLKELKIEFKYKSKKLVGMLNKIIKALKEYMVGEHGNVIIKEGPVDIMGLLRVFTTEGETYLKEHSGETIDEIFLNVYFSFLDFIRIGELFSEDFILYCNNEDKDIVIKIFCLNPSNVIKECIKGNISTVFFSATLSPMNYFKKLLGGDEKSYGIKLASPFPPENRQLIVKKDIDTRYKYREKSYYPICKDINSTIESHKGNFLVFFPSFEYMRKVYEVYCENFSEENIYLQDNVMTEQQRQEFLDRFLVKRANTSIDEKEDMRKLNEKDSEAVEEFQGFYDENNKNRETVDYLKKEGQRTIGFAVLGGVFSEGIDLIGESLVGAIIVGVGLPKISFERKLIEEFFNKKGEPGFHYAYTFPGINKVIQAMGRVIRTEEDKGIILLLDNRYGTDIYKQLMPL
ncbi:ATP-dependent DNA helicase [Clostridium sp.]|uniref:ATP-dependent DNA helicase n=1 Tax=Clostridium sp. TaxID=1506 RepID=UPI00321674A1